MEAKRGGSAHRLMARFARICGADNIELARYGIERHIYYCDKAGIEYDIHAIAEIITDAQDGISIARENELNNALARKMPLDVKGLSLAFSARQNATQSAKKSVSY